MKLLKSILCIFFLSLFQLLHAQVGIGTTAPVTDFNVHDSTSTANMMLSSGTSNSFGLRFNNYIGGLSRITSEKGDLILKAGPLSGSGTELTVFELGNIGIGKNITNATNLLHIQGTNPLRLEGLNEDFSPDSVLVVGSNGVIRKAHVNRTYSDTSLWKKIGNKLFTNYDSVGIGGVPKSLFHVRGASTSKSIFEGGFTKTTINLNTSDVQMDLVQFGYIGFGPILTDNIPSKSLSTLIAKENTNPNLNSKGLLLNVEPDKPIIFATDNTERMRLDSLGQLGLGTNDPSYLLDVNGDAYIDDKLRFDKIGTTQLYMSGANLRIESQGSLQLRPRTGYDVRIYEGGSEYATFDADSQSLGIGVTSPEQKLDVIGNIQASDSILIFDSESSITKSASNLVIRADNALELRGGAPSKDVKIFADNTEWAVFDGATERLGIGTLSPTTKLDVAGAVTLVDSLFITNSSNSIYKSGANLNMQADANLKLKSGGSSYDVAIYHDNTEFATFEGGTLSLGLGTSSPRERIDVIGNAMIDDTLFISDYDHSIREHTASGNLEMKSNSDIRLNAGASQDVLISTNGSVIAKFQGSTQNVGIGTLSPAEKLDVDGTVQADRFKMTDSPINGYVMITDPNGLGSWGPVPPDGDWIITGPDMQSGLPGNVQIGVGPPPTSKLTLSGSLSTATSINPAPSITPTLNDHTLILTAAPAQVTLPIANTCPGREYVLKFINPGGLINAGIASDFVEGVGTFAVLPPTTPGLLGSVVTLKSDGVDTWWIINMSN